MIKEFLLAFAIGIFCFVTLFVVTLVLGFVLGSLVGNDDIILMAWLVACILLAAVLACLFTRSFFIW